MVYLWLCMRQYCRAAWYEYEQIIQRYHPTDAMSTKCTHHVAGQKRATVLEL